MKIEKTYRATITRIIDESPIVKRFFFSIPEQDGFAFSAGQFIALNIPGENENIRRYYSIASAPSVANLKNDYSFELCISFKPGGAGSALLWDQISEGSIIEVEGPYGKFLLEQPIDRELCFIATGTGIAPLRSMIVNIYEAGLANGPITLISGNRTEADNLYAAEFETLQAQHPEFRFIPTLSRPSFDWTGEQGYVHAVYQKLFADKRPATFYLCGWQNMLKEARNTLEAMGYEKAHIRFESYG
ncbi:MAG: ferredoxin--NADP reductase [Bacteroidota bacterium]